MPCSRHAEPEPEVGHHGDDDGVARRAARGRAGRWRMMAMIWSPSIESPVGVDGQHPVGVAVEGEPDVGAALDDRRLQVLGVGRAAAGVDVRAVGRRRGAPRRSAPRRAQHRRAPPPTAAPLAQSTTTRSPSRPRPSIERDDRRRPSASTSAGAVDDRADRVARASGVVALVRRAAASARPRAPPRRRRSSLRPPGANSFMPLSSNGLCDAEITAPADPSAAASQATAGVGTTPRRRRRRTPSDVEPRDQRRLEQRPGPPRVAADDELLARRAPGPRRGRGRAPARG